MKKFSILSMFVFVSACATAALAGADDVRKPQVSNSSYKYVEFSKTGDPATVLEVKTESQVALQAGEVRINVLAAPIHPSNLLTISGGYLSATTLPSRAGSEGIGRIVETSAGVNHLKKGQLVLLAGLNTWAEQIVAPAVRVIPLPDFGDISTELIEQFSMSSVNPMAALLMLTEYVDLKPGDWVVQSASNSAVGGYVIQLAKQRGIKTINIVRREGLEQELMAKGADVVLVNGPDLAKSIAEATGNAPIRLAVDAVGGETFSRLADSLGVGGTMVTYGVLSGKFPSLDLAATIAKDIRIRGFWLSKWFQTSTGEERQAAFGQIIPLVANGTLRADVDSRFSVTDIKKAVKRSGQSGRNGKVLLVADGF